MPRGRALVPLDRSDGHGEQLLSWTRSTSMAQDPAQRARFVLASAEGRSNTAVRQRFALQGRTVAQEVLAPRDRSAA